MVVWLRFNDMTFLIIIAVFLLLLAAAAVWIFINPGFYVHHGVARVSLQGKLQLEILRLVTPLFAGVDKSLGLEVTGVAFPQNIKLPQENGGAGITVYRPEDAREELLPLYINFHGGGFVVGFAEQDDLLCRYIAINARCVVVNVDYLLAPENPFPAPVHQCYQTVLWLEEHAGALKIDFSRTAIGGQSAGASISAAICMLAKELKQDLFCQQILNYGYFDTHESPVAKYIDPNVRQALGPKMLAFFQNLYVPFIEDRGNQLASPLLSNDLTDFPDALVITAEHDLMKNDGNRYSEKLTKHGVRVVHREFKEADHGFIHNGPKGAANEALELMVATLKNAFKVSP